MIKFFKLHRIHNPLFIMPLISLIGAIIWLTSAYMVILKQKQAFQKLHPIVEKWKIINSRGRFVPVLYYGYIFNEQHYKGHHSFSNFPSYSPEAAMEITRDLETNGLVCWIYPKNPSFPIFNKHFPYKEIIYGIILLFVTFYFILIVVQNLEIWASRKPRD